MVARYPSGASLDGSGLPGIRLGPLVMGVWVARYPYFSAQLISRVSCRLMPCIGLATIETRPVFLQLML